MKYLFFIVTLLLFSCGQQIAETEAKLSFSTKTFSSKRCIDDNCAKVEVSYPVAENSPAADPINEDLMEQMLLYFNNEKGLDNLDSAASNFLDSYEEFKNDFPEAPGEWSIELEVELSYESDSTLSFKFSEFNYSGGAHPNSSVYYMNFDKQSGEYLSVDRLLLDEKKLLGIAEKAFRKHHEVEEGKSLGDAGFFLPETGFFLPNAMGYEGDKFVMIYIPYEIGPYVMGYTELEFELKDLEGVVRQR
ncbi:DUF3298 and DUF4163 domain-containing protein [Algoriphagus chordae]|uniref:Uncharacterized protein DUF4163 n=1 Tax=Algoriphagus chordae TaxID=237019 RepID=A0A2W7QLP0_9BACT|nr:DUF4163 domain-containing protein [Algoriphagus chordae]PZX49388.1 uncharacterized protein DUF4163 [Algoriphagus chordae]